jgi:hypothetical protein
MGFTSHSKRYIQDFYHRRGSSFDHPTWNLRSTASFETIETFNSPRLLQADLPPFVHPQYTPRNLHQLKMSSANNSNNRDSRQGQSSGSRSGSKLTLYTLIFAITKINIAPLNATANAFNPQDVSYHNFSLSEKGLCTDTINLKTHQALHQASVKDSPGSRAQHGVIRGGDVLSWTMPATLGPPPHGANRAVWAQLATGISTSASLKPLYFC